MESLELIIYNSYLVHKQHFNEYFVAYKGDELILLCIIYFILYFKMSHLLMYKSYKSLILVHYVVQYENRINVFKLEQQQ